MTQAQPKQSQWAGKGKAFFERAEQVAETGNWDFAIEMYCEGLLREPDNVDRGHQALREVSLKRKATGGKGPGLRDQMKRRGGKDAITKLINAEYLLAKDPGSASHMGALLKAAGELECVPVIKWICDIMLESQRQASKPNKGVLGTLTRAYDQIEDYLSAIKACQLALTLSPDDNELQNLLRDLGANATIQQGKYDVEEGDFTKSVKDMERQKELAQSEYLAQSRPSLEKKIEESRKDYLPDPTVQGKIHALVDALLKIEEESYENEAADVLAKAYRDTSVYQFKMRIGDIRIRQMTRRYRKLLEAGDKAGAAQQAKEQLAFELAEFEERGANYPTDMDIKFELGRRQLLAGRLDDAIASFQQAQRNPRRHVRAMGYLGQAFAGKKWYREAAETYEKALSSEMSEERSKEIRYNLADAMEKMAETRGANDEKLADYEKSREQYSQVAQIDYNYRDVRERMERLAKKIDQARGAG